jgi:hypothetical protein
MPMAGKASSEIAMPAGQELTKIAIAVAISLPANQSVTILVIRTLSNTPPPPATSRPAICHPHDSDATIASSPASISARAKATVTLSPNFWPIAPPGSASATPGVK